MTDAPRSQVLESILADDPARDSRFEVKDRWKELVSFRVGSNEYRLEFFHRQMNEEANVMENAAKSIVDFPDADWDVRKSLARQCSDEARHVLAYLRIMRQRGVEVGDYPVLNFQYRILQKIDTLIGRLAVENRTFEADGLDAATFAVAEARAEGDEALAEMMDSQQADEILHVGFANHWVRAQVRKDPKNVLAMASALTEAVSAFEYVFEKGAHMNRYPVAEDERREAGFDRAEIAVAARMSEELRSRAAGRAASLPDADLLE